MNKIYRLAELGKLNFTEVLIFSSVFLAGPIFLMFGNILFKVVAFTVLFGLDLFLLILYKREKGERNFPRHYATSLFLLLFTSSSIVFLALISNQTVLIYSFVIVFFAYLLVGGIVVYLIINYIYTFGLKKMFPYEREVNVKKVDELSLKKLSKYIDLDNQKLYFSTTMINTVVYLAFVFFGMLLLIKHLNGEQLIIIRNFSAWVKNQDSITLFNWVSLFSLMIAVYTITFSAQRKIINEAKQRYSEKRKEYL